MKIPPTYGNEFLSKTGLGNGPQALLNGYPLDLTSSSESLDVVLFENIQKQTLRLQFALYQRLITDSVKIDEFWLKEETNPDLKIRVNIRIVKAFNEKRFVNSDSDFSENSENSENPTLTIIANFENSKNRLSIAKWLKSLNLSLKIALISNPTTSSDSEESSCPSDSEDLESAILRLENQDSCIGARKFSNFLRKNEIPAGEMTVIFNGLVIGPFEENEKEEFLEIEDFEFLENLWEERGAKKTSAFLSQHFPNQYDVTIRFFSILSKIYQKDVPRIAFDNFKDPENRNLIIFPPKNPESPFSTITWILNPVSREAQHLVSIVKLMSNVLNAKVEIIFNPPNELHEMPIKRFYRFVASEFLEFDENGKIKDQSAIFSNLPQKQLSTMSVETNDGWMIEVKKADDDLDNILLENTSGDVESEFSLEHILVEGQSQKSGTGDASNGLELELKSENTKYDTIVMRNLGYFQLKAEPGIWNLRIRNGTSSENFRIQKVDSKEVHGEITVVVDSFTRKWTQLVVKEIEDKKEQKEGSAMGRLMEKAKNFFSTPPPSETINVFSLASGHLYERFMRIMIASVMKNTQSRKVKFWLLKNYLSPKFKESIPILADFYGFEYELVEYKWPKWLHQQTEKQRVMWGYKILFLDVLFPLNVDKIIFVDADQVVRADLLELMDFDLKGAPYGYVPFCESRKEMDGFRFWKTGYWNTHLMGRRYHISALYVVDLKAFRKFAAGDRLRGRYDNLSADPNSLSNLDQDLPNNMIHEVPIKSLPQDWLWCETWCDDRSKKTAKTIDLCNNPLTKEPKLSSAQRIIGEWKTLDKEISNVIEKRIRKNSEEEREETEESREEL
ncbi:hypothetical protein B9Z55_000453 [Caenorhabditis nigoni]|uniref:Glucosyltransferase 24 catalytic domain-containing protein n=1 Tax=Caenorhabditis nigoni TaxID=1611254 RepID=A0A2G5VT87_9PELO|nr:hypothetical protein B9Z55_000453 [Caenorhabditis nigoni]